jgi:VanZ family protein
LKTRTRHFLQFWLPAIVWTGLVLTASGNAFSAENTGSILEMILTKLFGPIPPERFLAIHFFIRKAAHVTEYGILALLFFRAWRGTILDRWTAAWARHTLGTCLAVATLDEFHQGMEASRGSAVSDVLLDMSGVLLALCLLWFRRRRRA